MHWGYATALLQVPQPGPPGGQPVDKGRLLLVSSSGLGWAVDKARNWLSPGFNTLMYALAGAGGTALSMNWSDVGKRDYSKKGKGEDDDDEEWNERVARSSRRRP